MDSNNIKIRYSFEIGTRNIYANQYVDTSQRLRGFFHLMKHWRGSVLKLIWHDLIFHFHHVM